jgi:hypothetical protein
MVVLVDVDVVELVGVVVDGVVVDVGWGITEGGDEVVVVEGEALYDEPAGAPTAGTGAVLDVDRGEGTDGCVTRLGSAAGLVVVLDALVVVSPFDAAVAGLAGVSTVDVAS